MLHLKFPSTQVLERWERISSHLVCTPHVQTLVLPLWERFKASLKPSTTTSLSTPLLIPNSNCQTEKASLDSLVLAPSFPHHSAQKVQCSTMKLLMVSTLTVAISQKSIHRYLLWRWTQQWDVCTAVLPSMFSINVWLSEEALWPRDVAQTYWTVMC